MRDMGSVCRGILAIRLPYAEPRPWWTFNFKRCHWGFWAHWWTPIWHEGRGPYISIGLGICGIYRGY